MKISIITVCLNNEKTIEDTIQSVLKQTYKNYEHIIIDGLSTDNTLSIVNKYNHLKVVSEKDNGLYDAMNKGIKLATGDIVAILNADDILANENVFQSVIDAFDKDIDIVYGNIKYCNEDFSKTIRNFISGEKKDDAFNPAHPSMYVKKDVYKRIGLYNTNYKIAADYDFMIRCNKANVNYKYIKDYIVLMRYGGKSNGIGYLKNLVECFSIYKNNKLPSPLIETVKKCFSTIKQFFN